MSIRPSILRSFRTAFLLLAGGALAAGCRHAGSGTEPVPAALPLPAKAPLALLAQSAEAWAGIALSAEGRVFVTFPRGAAAPTAALAELDPVTGRTTAYPDAAWNAWTPGKPAGTQFVCAQSVRVDSEDSLWVLDSGTLAAGGVVAGAPKLVQFDLRDRSVRRVYPFGADAVPKNARLYDFRISNRSNTAYITDAGTGAILILVLNSGKARRVLEDDPSVHSEGVTVTVNGKPWLRPDGEEPDVHAAGLAISPNGAWLYYHALTAHALYRIPTEMLRNAALSDDDLCGTVELVARTGVADGILFGPDGKLYFAAVEENAILRLDTQSGTGSSIS